MSIPVTIGASSAVSPLPSGLARISNNEVVLIELQGTLEVECREERERDGRLIGRLGIDEKGTRATLRIGHHFLEGKVAQMPKPFAVMQRSHVSTPHVRGAGSYDALEGDNGLENNAADRREDDAMDLDAPPDVPPEQMNVSWDIIAVVKRKIIFSKRPMPIVGRTAPKLGGR
ncbi:Ctf8-domain-containing protein [Schizophyllum amplum]|uniref:Ctf8-domain-containing protein n=1 Tax=Schizophyllum amplum TaxID=97359 RepID=A0A550CI36_9AGAR|nr:Ctf8-domain-containing protein [Auriculariopsis ampla]